MSVHTSEQQSSVEESKRNQVMLWSRSTELQVLVVSFVQVSIGLRQYASSSRSSERVGLASMAKVKISPRLLMTLFARVSRACRLLRWRKPPIATIQATEQSREGRSGTCTWRNGAFPSTTDHCRRRLRGGRGGQPVSSNEGRENQTE